MTKFTVVHDDLFENLPDSWGYGPFGEYVDFQEGPGILAKDFHETGVPLLRLKSIESSTATLTGCNFLDPEKVEKKWSHFKLSIGDLLLSSSASLGRVSEVDESTAGALAYTGIIRMRPSNVSITKGFIRYFLQSRLFSHQIERSATGSVIKHFGPMHLKQMGITLPPVDDQKAIAHILGTLDDKIELNQKMNQTLEEIAKAIFKSWFVDFDPVRAKAEGRPTGLSPNISDLFPDELIDSEIGEIPEGWGLRRLDSLLELAYGKSLPAKNRLDGEVPVYGSGGVNGFHNEPLVEGTSIVVGRKGTVGSLYWVDKPFFPIDTVFYVRTEESIHYCFYLMQTLRLDTMNTDAAVPGLNRDNAYRLEFPNAPTPLVNHFSEIAKSTRDRISIAEEENKVLSELRDTLLPKLISGELRIPDAEKFLEEAGI